MAVAGGHSPQGPAGYGGAPQVETRRSEARTPTLFTVTVTVASNPQRRDTPLPGHDEDRRLSAPETAARYPSAT